MADLLQKKLGDLLSELGARRDELRGELDRVNAQLDLLANLVSPSPAPSKTAAAKEPGSVKTNEREQKPAATEKSGKAKSNPDSAQPGMPKQRKKRGRPKGSGTKAASKSNAASANNKTEKTLKEELFMIARSNGGHLRVRDASKQLVKSGRYDDAAKASANIHAAIAYYSANFVKDKSERGLYRVKGS